MGEFTRNNHKSMVEVGDEIPLIYHQIRTLEKAGAKKIVITTGHMSEKLRDYIDTKFTDLHITYVYNPEYLNTNYIYSMYLASDKLNKDIILLHGDLYFDDDVLNHVVNSNKSCVVVDSTLPLPGKDFKAEIEGGSIKKVATYIDNVGCVACQPLYKLNNGDWNVWKEAIHKFCKSGKRDVYAEEALNTVLKDIELMPIDLQGKLCMEVDTLDDLALLKSKIARYNCSPRHI